MREPGDLAPHKVPRSTRLKFQHHGFELGFAQKEEFKGKEINFIWGTKQIGQNLWCKVIESDRVKLVTIQIRFRLRLQRVQIWWIFLKNTRH